MFNVITLFICTFLHDVIQLMFLPICLSSIRLGYYMNKYETETEAL